MDTRKPTVVITGATGGIGAVVARYFAGLGWRLVILTGFQHRQGRWYQVADSLQTEYYAIQEDLASPDLERGYLPEILEQMGSVDILATCHGAQPCIKPTAELSESDIATIINTDLVGTLRVCQVVYPYMRRHGGLMALLSSFHAIGSYPRRAPYAAAKAGVCGLVRALACEWGRDGIRVNAIAPGQVANKRTYDLADESKMIAMKQCAPAGQLVNPIDIAKTIEMLFKVSSINGQTIVLDHGVTASLWYEPYPTQ